MPIPAVSELLIIRVTFILLFGAIRPGEPAGIPTGLVQHMPNRVDAVRGGDHDPVERAGTGRG